MDKEEVLIARIKRARNRKRVLQALHTPSMPSEIVQRLYSRPSASYNVLVSRALKELLDLKLVRLLNPLDKTGRVYTLTAKGKRIRDKI